MRVKGWIAIMLSLCLLGGCLSGCAPAGSEETADTAETTQAQETTEETTEATEPTEPDDGSFKMYYDDRLPIEELTGSVPGSVELQDQQVTSKSVDTGEADAAVLQYDAENCRLIAVGAGKVTVVADGTSYPVTVRPAPISLVMITGHSIGAGQCGVKEQSVLCEEGQAYSSITADGILPQAKQGIGSTAAVRPNGIDAFTGNGTGTIGEGSALAWRWNQLTGEKIWVLNAAKGGSCINEWVSGTDNFNNAFAMFSTAQMTLANEVAAGHYKLRNQAIIYHSAANFSYKNVVFDNSDLENWYSSMCEGFLDGLAMDITGDGKEDKLNAFGFAPIWGANSVNSYELDRPVNFYMATSKDYPQMYIATTVIRDWVTDISTFPAIEYTPHGQEVKIPTFRTDLHAPDGVHLTQEAYNALGLDIADNLYAFLREKTRAAQIKLVDEFGSRLQSKLKMKVGTQRTLVVVPEDANAAELTFTVTDNLSLSFPLVVTAVAPGDGTLTISDGDTVLKTVTITVE